MSVVNYLKGGEALTIMPHSAVFAQRKEGAITALPITIPHPERALAILKRSDLVRAPARPFGRLRAEGLCQLEAPHQAA
jgi:hypothetical protein